MSKGERIFTIAFATIMLSFVGSMTILAIIAGFQKVCE